MEKRYVIKTLSVDRVLNKEHFYMKNYAENIQQKLAPDPFLILLNNSQQPSHARNSFKNKDILKKIYQKVFKK